MVSRFDKTDERDEEEKPSFGGRLDHLIATPSPTRQSRRLKERHASTDSKPIIHEKDAVAQDTAGVLIDAARSGLTSCRRARGVVTSPSRKDEVKCEDASPNKENGRTPNGSATTTPRSSKKRKVYDDTQFEGMKGIPDRIAPDLDILFCGINPGVRSSEEGFHYAHPSNRFYRILHESGLTPYKLKPSESPEMPDKYSLGLTDLVLRCTARADQVPSMEFQAGATVLLKKIIQYRPKMVCFVGMDVYRQFRKHFARVPGVLPVSKGKKAESLAANDVQASSPSPSKKSKRSTSDVQPGLQNLILSIAPEDGEKKSTAPRGIVRLFVIPSTSGLAAGYSDADRVSYLQEARAVVDAFKSTQETKEERCDSDHQADIVVLAEDFLEEQIVKLPSGQWALAELGVSR